jgi:hypothetical protein
MENEIKKIIVFILITASVFAQKTKPDTLKMFEGHWVFKMAINSKFSQTELEDTYLKNYRGGKIHIIEQRIYGNYLKNLYLNFEINSFKDIQFFNYKTLNKDEYNIDEINEFIKLGIGFNKKSIGFFYNPKEKKDYEYSSILLFTEKKILRNISDETMLFLEQDKSEYKFIGVKEAPIYREDKSPTLNKVLENEEVEILEKGEEYTKIRYWGKALIIGWVKTKDLRDDTRHPEYWNIYKENSIKFKVLSTKSFINDNLFQKTNSYLIKGDTIEVLEEKGFNLKIKYNNIIGFIPRIDVEGYNTFRITKSKATLHSSLSVPTKMYLLKGDDIELIDRAKDWLKIRYYGKKVVEGWIKQSDVE